METTQIKTDGMTMRRLGPADETAVERLAQRDSAERPEGSLIGVEVEGKLLAARSLDSGATIADPFSRTGEMRKLLSVRARQLNGRSNHRFGRRHSRGSLAGSPTGAGGKLLTLPVRQA